MLTRAIFDVISTMAIAILMTVFSLGDLLTVASALGIVAVLPALAAKLETKGAKLWQYFSPNFLFIILLVSTV